jgi:hypothetical protein
VATVRFFTDEQGALPDVCIETGQPTSERVTLSLVYRPTWPILLLPLSLLATVVGMVAGARHTEVTIPLMEGAVRRHRQWSLRSLLFMFVTGIGAILAEATGRHDLAFAMVALFLAGAIAHWYVNMTLWCGFSVNRDCTVVTVRRCHRNFLSAMRALSHKP